MIENKFSWTTTLALGAWTFRAVLISSDVGGAGTSTRVIVLLPYLVLGAGHNLLTIFLLTVPQTVLTGASKHTQINNETE